MNLEKSSPNPLQPLSHLANFSLELRGINSKLKRVIQIIAYKFE